MKKKSYKVGTCGNYDSISHVGDGQIIRTTVVTQALSEHYGADKVKRLSYNSWKKHPISLFVKYVLLFCNSEAVVIFPDLRCYMLLIRIGLLAARIFKTRVFYNVIGGWLPEYVEKEPRNIKFLNKLDGIFVQTRTMQKQLASAGVTNTVVFPNFRYHTLSYDSACLDCKKPIKAVFAARVAEKKGVTGLIKTITEINSNGVRYTLDIYGQVDERYRQEFEDIMKHAPQEISYCGSVQPTEISAVISKYSVHIFPTLFTTEGYPGSVLDAFYAGVPTVSAKWDSFDDVIDDGVNGIGFSLGNYDELREKLLEIYNNPNLILSMRSRCIDEARKFQPAEIIKIMCSELDKNEK